MKEKDFTLKGNEDKILSEFVQYCLDNNLAPLIEYERVVKAFQTWKITITFPKA